MSRLVALLLLLVALSPAWARTPVPLMPPKLGYTSQDSSAMSMSVPAEKPRQVIGLGAELGLVGRRTSSAADLLGLQMFWGGRVFARIPVLPSFYLKPSLGFFRNSDGAGSSSVTQNVLEGGLTAYYSILSASRLRWFGGVVQRVEHLTSTISAMGTSDNASDWRYRLGPGTGIAFGIGPDVSLTADAEATFAFTSPVRPYAGFTAGFVYYLR